MENRLYTSDEVASGYLLCLIIGLIVGVVVTWMWDSSEVDKYKDCLELIDSKEFCLGEVYSGYKEFKKGE